MGKKLIYFVVFISCIIGITLLIIRRAGIDSQVEVHKKLARDYWNEGKYQDSEKEYKKALELVPEDVEDVEVLVGLGLAYHVQGKYDDAISCHEKALEINPESTRALNNLADAYLRKGDYKKAKDYVLKALEIKPDMAAARATLAEIYLAEGDYSVALVEFKMALQNLKKAEPQLEEYIQNKIDETKKKMNSSGSIFEE